MEKEYLTPEFEYKEISFINNALSVSNPEVTIPEEIGTLPRDNNDDW